MFFFFFFQAEDGIRDLTVTGVQTCALPIFVLAGLWRARRLGPLITERLPVVVRASETVEGHAGLYQSRRARDRAAAALREDLLARVLPVLGLVKDTPADAVTGAVTARSRHGGQDIARILYGPAPGSDAE